MDNKGKCHFCGNECYREAEHNPNAIYFDCRNCGKFVIYADNHNVNRNKKHLIAGYLHEFNRSDEYADIDYDRIFNDGRMPHTSMQRMERFLMNLYKIDDSIGKIIRVADKTVSGGFDVDLLAISYAKHELELAGMLNSLAELGYMTKKVHTSEMSDFWISAKGFERAEQLLTTNIDSKSVFIAMGYKNDLIEACEKAIKLACRDCGFEARLITDKPHNNGITDEIMTEIKRCKFVIVDFTYNNCGAYFEAGYAQGLGRQIIRCCKSEWFYEKDENDKRVNFLHFDVQHYNTIIWESHDDLYKKLKNNIRVNIDGAILEEIK
jgi:nucleoside 2-deoxyribosyltransferase